MRHLAAIALSGSILLASGPAFAADPQGMRTSKAQTLPLDVKPLAPEGAFWSLALPGGGQFYQGDHARGAAYLGGAVGLAAGLAAIQFPLFGMFPSGEQIAFAAVQGTVISWVVMGGISAYDAYHSILAKQPAETLAVVVAPSPAPENRPVAPRLSAQPPRDAVTATLAPAAPTPAPTPGAPDPEALVLDSYRLADEGKHWQAVTRLLSISDPSWLPKARTLLGAWGDDAGAQGLDLAREQLARGERSEARATLDQLEKLPLKSSLRQQVRTLRLQLGDRS
ncbi:hypothetical protein J7643_02030 [bacterium]|nr:hypothetical protein [bacterium]